MKYHVEPCPNCGFGDAEEDANGVGVILGFHPQDPKHKKLPGTIFFIGCTHCQYVGPIVLCKCGLNERQVINAWNEHIKPGCSLSTAQLVAELEKRDGIELLVSEHFGCLYRATVGYIHPNFKKENSKKHPWRDSHDYNKLVQGFGPAKILVIGNIETVLQYPSEEVLS